jgi:ribonuclease HI
MHFTASNNAVEYETLLHGLQIATPLDIRRLKVLRDSLLIVNQANKVWSCLDEKCCYIVRSTYNTLFFTKK